MHVNLKKPIIYLTENDIPSGRLICPPGAAETYGASAAIFCGKGENLEFLQLTYFKTVAEYGKIVTAAEALFITPPALSASISRLEKELGMKLFVRTGNSISLNTQGEIFLRYVNQILSSVDNAKLELEQSVHDKEPHIRLAMTLSHPWINLLSAFSQDYPHITLSNTTLKLSQVPETDLYPRYNFLFSEERAVRSARFDSIPLITDDQPLLMVSPGSPLAKLPSVDLRDLKEETFLLNVADTSLNELARRLLSMAGIAAVNVYEYSYMVRRRMVLNGRGISFSTAAASRGEDTDLCFVPIACPRIRQTHRIYWDKDRPLTPEGEAFLAYVRDYFAVSPG